MGRALCSVSVQHLAQPGSGLFMLLGAISRLMRLEFLPALFTLHPS